MNNLLPNAVSKIKLVEWQTADMLSLPKIAGGSRKNSFSHASRNLKKNLLKKQKPDFESKLFKKAMLVN